MADENARPAADGGQAGERVDGTEPGALGTFAVRVRPKLAAGAGDLIEADADDDMPLAPAPGHDKGAADDGTDDETADAGGDDAPDVDSADDGDAAADDDKPDGDDDGEARAEGVPDDPDEYVLTPIKDHKWDEADEPLFRSFAARAHEAGLSQAAMDHVLTWYAAKARQAQEARVAADGVHRDETRAALQARHGDDWRGQVGRLRRQIEGLGDFGERLLTARLPDGRLLLNDPDFPSFMLEGAAPRSAAPAVPDPAARERELLEFRAADSETFSRRKNGKGQLLSDELLELRRRRENRGGQR